MAMSAREVSDSRAGSIVLARQIARLRT